MNKILLPIILVALFLQLSFAEDGCHIIFGMRNNKPSSWIDANGKPMGQNIDLLNVMTKGAGCTYEIKMLNSWGGAVDALENGEITMISMTPTKRTDTFAIYIPQSNLTPRYIFTRTGEPTVTTKEDLRGKSIVISGGGFSDEVLTDMQDDYNIKIIRYPSSEEAVQEFSRGSGDTLMSTFSIVANLSDRYAINNIVSSGIPVISPSSAFAMHKSNIETYTKLMNVLEESKASGEYFEILKKWAAPPKHVAWYKYLMSAAAIMAAVLLVVFIWIKSLRMQVAKRTAQLNKEINENVKLRDEALMAGRLAVLGEMSANVAHEINNPTGLMMHNTDFIRDFCSEMLSTMEEHVNDNDTVCGFPWKDLKSEVYASINSVDECLFRIKTTVDELKSFAKRSSSTREIVNAGVCAQSAAKFSGFFIRKHTKNFNLNIIEPVLPVLGNTLQIEQMVVNLIQNSCQALTSREQGITCVVRPSADSRFMIISVCDGGCGMSEEVVKKAHNAFFTTRKESGGTGLGLSIIDRLMSEHSGHYTIESTLGEGTTVSLYFPVAV